MLANSPSIYYKDINNPLLNILQSTNGVIFPLQPIVNIQYSAQYEEQSLTHSNFSYWSYKNSSIKPIDLIGEFPIKTPYDGQYVLAALHFLRSLTFMFTGWDAPYAGAPPMVVSLSGMGFGGLDNIPVVISNVTTTYPDNVDYVSIAIPGLQNEIIKLPTQMSIAVSCIPVFSRSFASLFSNFSYSLGGQRLVGPNPINISTSSNNGSTNS
jgi:hypothetical protein